MNGRCPSCGAELSTSDYAEILRCPRCRSRFHPEAVRASRVACRACGAAEGNVCPRSVGTPHAGMARCERCGDRLVTTDERRERSQP